MGRYPQRLEVQPCEDLVGKASCRSLTSHACANQSMPEKSLELLEVQKLKNKQKSQLYLHGTTFINSEPSSNVFRLEFSQWSNHFTREVVKFPFVQLPAGNSFPIKLNMFAENLEAYTCLRLQ